MEAAARPLKYVVGAREHSAHQKFQLGSGPCCLTQESVHPIAAVGLLAKLLLGLMKGMGLPITEELRTGEGKQDFHTVSCRNG